MAIEIEIAKVRLRVDGAPNLSPVVAAPCHRMVIALVYDASRYLHPIE